jgi:hypothetical protein
MIATRGMALSNRSPLSDLMATFTGSEPREVAKSAHHFSREARDVHLRPIGVLHRRNVQQDRSVLTSSTAEDTPVASDSHVATGPGVHLRDLAGGEDPLV